MTVQTWFSMKQILFGAKKNEKGKKMMSSVVEDKCFICFHTDFSSSKLMPPQPFFFNTVHHFM